jgi:hypothetical protein
MFYHLLQLAGQMQLATTVFTSCAFSNAISCRVSTVVSGNGGVISESGRVIPGVNTSAADCNCGFVIASGYNCVCLCAILVRRVAIVWSVVCIASISDFCDDQN